MICAILKTTFRKQIVDQTLDENKCQRKRVHFATSTIFIQLVAETATRDLFLQDAENEIRHKNADRANDELGICRIHGALFCMLLRALQEFC